jgi:hypothetical protein
MKRDIYRRRAMQIALAKLQERIDRGEVENPEERIEQIKRAFGGEDDGRRDIQDGTDKGSS